MRLTRLICASVLAALLAACFGDGGGGSSDLTVTGGVVKGPVLGATVCAYAISGGAKGAPIPVTLGPGAAGSISAGCYVTAADGGYNFRLPAGTSGDLLIEARGGTFCTNEAPVVSGACTGGALVNLGTATMTSAVAVPAPGGSATVYTTPLTTAAVTGAGASLTAAAFSAKFNTLAGQVIGSGTAVTPATPPTAANQPYLTAAATALQNGGTLGAVVTALANGTTTFTGPGGAAGATTPATINPALATSYTLAFYKGSGAGCGTRCTFTEGQTVPVTIGADGTLSIAGKNLSNPFYRSYGGHINEAEAIWSDTSAGVEYALTNNQTGQFSEINVGDASKAAAGSGIPGFLGQIRRPEVPSSVTLQQIAGSYTGARQYAGTDVNWSGITVAADGAITFTGSGTYPNISSANVSTVTSYVSCCNRVDIFSKVELNGDGTLDSDDRISLFLDPNGLLKDVEYYVGPSNASTSLRGVSVVGTNTLSPLAAPGTGTWAIPTTNQVTAKVDGTPVTVTANMMSGTTGQGFQITAQETVNNVLQKAWVINVTNAGGGIMANTNYSCVHGQRTKFVQLQTSSSDNRSTKQGGDCNIYITRVEAPSPSAQITAIEGRFVAEVYDFSRKVKTSVTEGAFRYVVAP